MNPSQSPTPPSSSGTATAGYSTASAVIMRPSPSMRCFRSVYDWNTTRPIPPLRVASGPRSPDPAAPIQWTSGHAGSALAVPANSPTAAAPAVATALPSVEIRRNIGAQPFLTRPGHSRGTSPQLSHVLQLRTGGAPISARGLRSTIHDPLAEVDALSNENGAN